ncbi:glycosyltransferase family A protein [Roseisalinus antarcticus]|uniref:Glycosyl transferase family 2 n=1 Tax=Roseisalinus antarcticus TaxID=254357 RepID=A0A1Y5TSX0_9RHOB|nr:glycosyltransferase family A protein [Roseisalinus antarcticus]SLN68894.1 Glycosyl transferase family 2 [Roseisalinus antarcticus]
MSPAATAPPDLTLALTVHAESLVAGPTLASAEAALARLEAAGYRVERLIGLDDPTPEARAFMTQPALAAWEVREMAFRDQGRTRNALAAQARGRWLAFLDADDLFSENWLIEAVQSLEAAGPGARVILHPEVVWEFDGTAMSHANIAQDNPLFTPHHLGIQNYYDALCLAPREAWTEVPFADRDIAGGFAYEDWQWAVETMAAGWHHGVVRDTLIFKRRRDSSQTGEARSRRVSIRGLAALAIDRIGRLGRPGAGGTDTDTDTGTGRAETGKAETGKTDTGESGRTGGGAAP